MNNKELIASISNDISRDTTDVSALLNGFIQILYEKLGNLDTVAIPGFGEFSSIKEDEVISIDYSSGKRYLLPPQIVIKFKPSSIIKKKLVN